MNKGYSQGKGYLYQGWALQHAFLHAHLRARWWWWHTLRLHAGPGSHHGSPMPFTSHTHTTALQQATAAQQRLPLHQAAGDQPWLRL